MAETQVRTIRVIADVKGDGDLKKIANSLGQLNKSAKDTADTLTKFKNFSSAALGASIFGFGVREVIQIADSMTTLRSRITALTGDAEKTASVLKQLNEVANQTKSNVDDIKEVYGRVAVATQRLNLATEAQIALTRILQQSFRLSGATAAEAQASTIQFAQALSFGQLRGQELRSVLSQNAVLAGVFSKAIEGSGKDIYKFAEAGGFTTKFVLKALADNFEDIDTKANTLAQTFEQTLTLATNKLKVAIDDVNREFNLNGKFATFMQYIIDNGPTVAKTLGDITVAVATKGSVTSLEDYGSIIVKVGGFVDDVTKKLADLKANGLTQLQKGLELFLIEFEFFALRISQILLSIFPDLSGVLGEGFGGLVDSLSTGIENRLDALQIKAKKTFAELQAPAKAIKGFFDFSGFDAGDTPMGGNSLAEAADSLAEPIKSLKVQIGALNVAFNAGKIDAQEYVTKLERLESLELKDKLSAGEISVKKFNEEIQKNRLEGFATLLDAGAISIEQFNERVRLFKIDQLQSKFNAGKITAAEFTGELVKLQKTGFGDFETYLNGFQAGVGSYLESLGTLSSQIATVVESSFGRFEDAIFKATKGATDSFANMAQAILDDLTRIAIRMAVVQPIAGAFQGLFTPGVAGATAGFNSAPLNSPVVNPIPFASGGVVDSPTFFGMAGRKTGVAGEAGPEAIIPLKRGAGGQLGVGAAPVSITIVNNAGAEISSKEQRNPDGSLSIALMINQAVKEGISSGSYDRTFQQAYGLNRKGI